MQSQTLRPWNCCPSPSLGRFRGGGTVNSLTLRTLVRVEDAGRLTLKAFRASKASNMISAGEPLKTVLTWGEWRSRAVLNYIDENAVEQAALLEATLIASDDEGEPETSPDKMSRWNERGTSVSALRDSAQVDEAAEACPP